MQFLFKYCLFFSILISCISCAGDFETNRLSEYKELRAEFTETELTDLQIILDFYVQTTCGADTIKKDKVIHCFMDQLRGFEDSKYNGELPVPISYIKQQQLYANIDQSTFDEIWRLRKSIETKKPEVVMLQLHHKGIFFKLMSLLQKDYPRFKKLTKSYEAAGDLTPSMFADILLNHTEYNLFDDRVRLFFTLHYLTINDQNRRNHSSNN